MIFMPFMWQDDENEENILRDNLENAVRQLTIEQRVIAALRNESESDEIIRDPTGTAIDNSIVEKYGKSDEDDECASKEELLLATINELSEKRIDVIDNTNTIATEDITEVANCCDD